MPGSPRHDHLPRRKSRLHQGSTRALVGGGGLAVGAACAVGDGGTLTSNLHCTHSIRRFACSTSALSGILQYGQKKEIMACNQIRPRRPERGGSAAPRLDW